MPAVDWSSIKRGTKKRRQNRDGKRRRRLQSNANDRFALSSPQTSAAVINTGHHVLTVRLALLLLLLVPAACLTSSRRIMKTLRARLFALHSLSLALHDEIVLPCVGRVIPVIIHINTEIYSRNQLADGVNK